jgi:hypothetical protein
MKRALVVLALLLTAAPMPAQEDARIRDLLQKLEDDRIGVRAASGEELAKLGREIVPLLRRAADDAGVEKADRLKEIIRKIEDRERIAALLPAPSRITLEAKNMPLREALLKLAKQSRTALDVNEVPEDARVTVSLRNVPYWRALEEICRASGRIIPLPLVDHIAFTAEPYVALPGLTTDHFRVTLDRIELSSNGTFNQPDHFERFIPVFTICWEKGSRPWKLSAQLREIVDAGGADTEVMADAVIPPLTADAINAEVTLDCQHGPGPQAVKINRLKVGIELEYPLRYSELRLDIGDGRLPPAVEGKDYSARLTRLDRQEGTVIVNLTIVPGKAAPEGEVTSDSLTLRDRAGREYKGLITDSPQTPDNESSYLVTFTEGPELAQLKELVIRIPLEIHREHLELDLKDIPLK